MNITDVGHLTGDMDMGEDKLEKGAKREGITAWDVAKKYEQAFKDDIEKLNILPPTKYTRATEYIDKQIELIQILEEKGYTYKTSDGIYFDTSKFADYNKLSHLKLDELQEGARVEKNDEKKIQLISRFGNFHQIRQLAEKKDRWNGKAHGVLDFLVGIWNVAP